VAYKKTLGLFQESCKKTDLEHIDRKDMLGFIQAMRDAGNAPRTVRNRGTSSRFFSITSDCRSYSRAKTYRRTPKRSRGHTPRSTWAKCLVSPMLRSLTVSTSFFARERESRKRSTPAGLTSTLTLRHTPSQNISIWATNRKMPRKEQPTPFVFCGYTSGVSQTVSVVTLGVPHR
jgi:hypothetical protein